MSAKLGSRIVLAVVLLSLLFGAALRSPLAMATVMPRSERHELRHDIEQAEEKWRTAMMQRNAAAMESLLADDYTAITPSGAIQTREQAISNLRSGALDVTAIFLSDRKIRIYGSTAVVTSRADITASKDDRELSGRYRYTRVYVRNPQGQWKIVSFEASRIQEPAERK